MFKGVKKKLNSGIIGNNNQKRKNSKNKTVFFFLFLYK
uniref:Uncharacterized protein n=1 Tax=viral metagenome TaxID=1070528 RepID=A0A6C0J2C1_9ZZZZ